MHSSRNDSAFVGLGAGDGEEFDVVATTAGAAFVVGVGWAGAVVFGLVSVVGGVEGELSMSFWLGISVTLRVGAGRVRFREPSPG